MNTSLGQRQIDRAASFNPFDAHVGSLFEHADSESSFPQQYGQQ
jgi:hypothetical protein